MEKKIFVESYASSVDGEIYTESNVYNTREEAEKALENDIQNILEDCGDDYDRHESNSGICFYHGGFGYCYTVRIQEKTIEF